MNKLISIILILLTNLTFGQVGVVTDPDGFINVREKASGKTISTLYEGEVFFVNVDYVDIIDSSIIDSTWISIEYGSDFKTGYVHHSLIRPLYQLNNQKESIPELIFKTNRISDTNQTWGYGGYNIPLSKSYELNGIALVMNGDTISQDEKFTHSTLTPFLPSGYYSHKDLVNKGKMFVYAYKDFIYYRIRLGDGSEYYEVVWVVSNGKIIQRLIGWIV